MNTLDNWYLTAIEQDWIANTFKVGVSGLIGTDRVDTGEIQSVSDDNTVVTRSGAAYQLGRVHPNFQISNTQALERLKLVYSESTQ
jgi:hypothetical protein